MSEQFQSQDWYRVADLAPRLRRDIEVARHVYLGEPWVVLANATGRKVHRMTAAAYAIAGRFDGRQSLAALWQYAQEEMGHEAPTQQEILTLLSQLHEADLLDNRDTPLLDEMLERRDRERRAFWKKLLLNPLSATLPLVNPDRLLARLVGLLSVLPGALWWGAGTGIILAALLFLPTQWAALGDRGLEGFLDLENLFLIGLIYPIVKVIHEFGHGIAAKARGGAVPEMGVVLVAFYPIPYVEASSALLFPSKWARAAVAAAGILIELVIASFALAVWSVTDEGTLRALAFNTMVISGLSTLLINGNPLLKFDGYHVLCDLIEVPNLAQRGNTWWGEVLRNRLLGTRERRRLRATGWERLWFVFYPPAALVYRVLIALSIALYVATTYRLIGIALAIWSLVLSLLWPALKLARQTLSDGRIRLAGARAWRGAGLAAVVLAALAFWPMPHHVVVQGVVWLPQEAFLRAPQSGIVQAQNAVAGAPVHPGETIFALTAPEVESRLAEARARVKGAKLALSKARLDDRKAVRRLEQTLTALRREETEALRQAAALQVESPHAGRLDIEGGANLSGRFVAKGALLAYVLPDGARLVRAAIPQRDVKVLREAPRAISVRFADAPFAPEAAHILRDVPMGAAVLPSPVLSLEGGGPFATTGGKERLQTTTPVFTVDLALERPDLRPAFGMRAFVRFTLAPKSLAARSWTALRERILKEFDV
ncbi:hypothetical protein U5922_005575 [Aquicoccus sp. G2-2]|uniref:hypothetical protein n=1 Tax=Aquicoccus sp. G2-2 TaxID=3092120 RepID=UPI002AE08B32|nr:hypothetical protein [Aquicoccus sp. G2-2]MEA1112964.1 hypothetical protein [Aquicoccus sp. G2-2]